MTLFQQQVVNIIRYRGEATPVQITDQLVECYSYDRRIAGAVVTALARLYQSNVIEARDDLDYNSAWHLR